MGLWLSPHAFQPEEIKLIDLVDCPILSMTADIVGLKTIRSFDRRRHATAILQEKKN